MKEKVNTRATFSTLGASNHVDDDRQEDDFYATDPIAIDILLGEEVFKGPILEPACGMGHMSKRLISYKYTVISTDLIDRGFSEHTCDFLTTFKKWPGDIITNPPYSHAIEFVEHAMEIIPKGKKVAMFLKILFLESQKRRRLFEKYPPKTVYISSNRICCAKDGDFVNNTTKAVGYAWYVWEKGFTGTTQLKWVN